MWSKRLLNSELHSDDEDNGVPCGASKSRNTLILFPLAVFCLGLLVSVCASWQWESRNSAAIRERLSLITDQAEQNRTFAFRIA